MYNYIFTTLILKNAHSRSHFDVFNFFLFQVLCLIITYIRTLWNIRQLFMKFQQWLSKRTFSQHRLKINQSLYTTQVCDNSRLCKLCAEFLENYLWHPLGFSPSEPWIAMRRVEAEIYISHRWRENMNHASIKCISKHFRLGLGRSIPGAHMGRHRTFWNIHVLLDFKRFCFIQKEHRREREKYFKKESLPDEHSSTCIRPVSRTSLNMGLQLQPYWIDAKSHSNILEITVKTNKILTFFRDILMFLMNLDVDWVW